MPRIRSLKPEHKQHRKVGPLSDRDYRLWVGMITEADDEGRLVADAEQLRVLMFGYHPKMTADLVSESLMTLRRRGLILLYTVDDVQYAAFPSWTDHQRVDHPSPSRFPAPPYRKLRIPDAVRRDVAVRYGAAVGKPVLVKCHYCEDEGVATLHSATGWASFMDLELDHLVPESRGGPSTAENLVLACRKCNRSKGCDDSPKPREASRSLANDTEGAEGSGEERKGEERRGAGRKRGAVLADAEFIVALKANPAYEGIDIDREWGKMDAWFLTPRGRGKQKTRGFVVNWLNRAERTMRPNGADNPYLGWPEMADCRTCGSCHDPKEWPKECAR